MRLLSVVSYHGANKLEATLSDDQGHRRRVSYVWASKDNSDTPPGDWWSAVKAEVEFQRGDEVAAAAGRKLP